jgi:TolA-binding protein
VALWLWPKPELEQAARTPAPPPSCALPTALSIAALDTGKQLLSLERFGTLVASEGSQLHIERSEACVLSVFLEQGELAGDLTNLKPAQLRVRTPHGTVVVRGTRFSVRTLAARDDQHDASELEVVLLSGRVDIEDETTQRLEPQHVFRKRGKRRETLTAQPPQSERIDALLRTLPQPHARAMNETVDPAPQTATEPAPARDANASTLLARAESERRQGEHARARVLYRQASEKYPRHDAEVALLRWVRLELEQRAFGSARQLLAQHAQRFADGKLRAEAAWLGVQTLRDLGQREPAHNAARDLITRFPNTPQADAARALLAQP